MKRRFKKIDKKGYKHLHKYCFFCGEDDYNALHCHRIISGEDGGTYHAPNTLTVCASCHAKVHSGRIKIDRKYTQASSPLYIVHYWLDGEEFWKNEEIGMFIESPRNCHSGLGQSAKRTGKRRGIQGTADYGHVEPEFGATRGEVGGDSSLSDEKKGEVS